ncbi:probable carboxylesterase 18 [Neltuma alba]|uniref:probable carboxylesterase 18 n=1 Tax=Neltuma alba TaxID=207710 RepID=UPI0010A561D5|nr:probable carboxylesterase 18 [Prosopis alba]XP_028774168.1 probable carboxylesterase 18 [Prosopis alba]
MASSTTNSKPLLPWKTRLSLSIVSAVTDALRRPDGTLNRSLMNFLDRKTSSNPNPIKGVKSSDVTVDPTRNLWFRLFTPTTSNSASLPVIVFFHGGGFTYLSPASFSYDAVCRVFARKFSAIVISVNYRLIPEHRYPAQYEDGFDVLQFIDQNSDALPDIADLSKCFLAGDSAGANLAHNVAIRVCRSRLQNVRIVGQISIQPFFGGEERTESETRLVNVPLVSAKRTDWIWKVFLPEGCNRDHEAVNVSGPNAVDISGMDYPGTLVFVGGFDPLQDWQRRFYEWLKKSGKEAELIEYPDSIHAFYLFPELPEASQLISQVKDFINKRLSRL